MAGVLGRRKICFDVWGKPLEDCHNMLPSCVTKNILISDSCHSLLTEKFNCIPSDEIPTKEGINVTWVPRQRKLTIDHSHPFLAETPNQV